MKNITILIVSYFSSKHLKRLITNLIEKSDQPNALQFLIVDNTNGRDKALKEILRNNRNIESLMNDGNHLQRSVSHAGGLDLGFSHIKSDYTLIIDPDVYVFREKWDTLFLEQLNKKESLIIGAPYPQWKVGKVHDYPSVVFMFFKTNDLKQTNFSFYPFPNILKKVKNSILRKIIRLGFLSSKQSLNKSFKLRNLVKWLEKKTGITSPDTGNKIIEALPLFNIKPLCFEAKYSRDTLAEENTPIYKIAKEFEVFFLHNELIMTHMYGSEVFYWKTKRGGDLHYWEKLISQLEGESYEKLS